MKRPSALASTAHHEAGHAVCAFFLRGVAKVRHVTIAPDPKAETLGHTRAWSTPSLEAKLVGDLTPQTQVRLHEEIIVLLGGGIAEKRFTGRGNHVGARHDYAHAADLALKLSDGDGSQNALLRWLHLRAEGLVLARWAHVTAVAAALLDEQTLDGTRLRKIITGR